MFKNWPNWYKALWKAYGDESMSKDGRLQKLEHARQLGEALERKIEEASISSERMQNLVGLCSTCSNFHYERTRLNSESFRCERNSGNPRPLNTSDPIEECSSYAMRGSMDLWDMKDIAILIEGNPKKVPGFNRDEWKK